MFRISEDKHFITKNNKKFPWIGDTAWELFHKLNEEDVDLYFSDRLKKGFNIIQCVLLAEKDGLFTPNALGDLPLELMENGVPNLAKPNPNAYWSHVDYIVEKAECLGLNLAILPIWGDKFNLKWGVGPMLLDCDERILEKAYKYGEWLKKRYGHYEHIIWVMGGDRPLETKEQLEFVTQIAKGLKGNQLMTFHPPGTLSSYDCVGNSEWLDFHMIQSGHCHHVDSAAMMAEECNPNPDNILWKNKRIIKPVVEGEPCYEDHPIHFNHLNGYYRDKDVRRAFFGAVMSGGAGFTYGHHGIWCFNTEPNSYNPIGWKEALNRPGAKQIVWFRKFFEMLLNKNFEGFSQYIRDPYNGYDRVLAVSDGEEIIAYTSNGKPVYLISKENDEAKYWIIYLSAINGEVLEERPLEGDDYLVKFVPKENKERDC